MSSLKEVMLAGITLLVTLLTLAPSAAAQDAKSAEGFVRGLYERYRADKDFSPFGNRKTAEAIATPSLCALVKRDQEWSRKHNEVGALDFDPLSGSQDSEGLQVKNLKVEQPKPDRATVTVVLRIQNEDVSRRLSLLALKGKWRIDNIADGDGKNDLRGLLGKAAAPAPR